MIILDGVMHAPVRPKEYISGGFKNGGWVALFSDEVGGNIVQKQTQSSIGK